MKIKQLACVGIIGLAMCQAAFAGGPEYQEDMSGPYVGVHGGVAIPGGDFFSDAFNTGPDLGVQVGYRIDNFRIEGAGTYYYNSVSLDGIDAHLNTFTLMLNGYYDFDFGSIVVPYLGAGIGWAHFSAGGSDVAGSPSDNEFAYQGIAGLDFKVAPNMTFGPRYRYVGWTTSGDDSSSAHFNVVELVFNYVF